MKRTWLGALLMVIATPSFAALAPGAAAPVFTAPASLAGKELTFSLTETLKKGPVVVYFYPSAYTGGCNMQAHSFAEEIDKFSAAGATVVGVSLDSIARLNKFSADPSYCAGKLAVASDPEGRIAKSYDLTVSDAQPGAKDSQGEEIGHGFAQRTTFVIASDGTIASVIGGVSPKENVDQTLIAVQGLQKTKPGS